MPKEVDITSNAERAELHTGNKYHLQGKTLLQKQTPSAGENSIAETSTTGRRELHTRNQQEVAQDRIDIKRKRVYRGADEDT